MPAFVGRGRALPPTPPSRYNLPTMCTPARHAWIPIALAVSALAGCAPDAPAPAVAVVSEMRTVTADTQARHDLDLFAGQAVELFAAANETVSFQMIVDAGAEPLEGLELTWTGLAGPDGAALPAEAISAWRALPIDVIRYPAWYLRLMQREPEPTAHYDPLVPVDAPRLGQPWNLPAGQRLVLWVDVRVPRTARPGTYTGRIELVGTDRKPFSADIRLDVLDLVLPDAQPLPAMGGLDHRLLFAALLQRDGKPYVPSRLDADRPMIRRGLELLRELMVLARDHRLDLFDAAIAPRIRRNGQGEVELDWSDYDNIVTPYLRGSAFSDRIGVTGWPSPLHAGWPDPQAYGGMDSPAYRRTVAQIARQVAAHAESLDATERMFRWPVRNPAGPDAYALHAHLAELQQAQGNGALPALAQLPPAAPGGATWTVPDAYRTQTDIYALPGQWLQPDLGASAASPTHPLRGAWLSPGAPPYVPTLGLLASGPDVRALPWIAAKYDCRGLFLPDVLNWSPAGSPYSPEGAETRLFYPGSPAGLQTVLPSVRLKRLRRGLQDAGYLWILRQRGRGAVADGIVNALIHYAGQAAIGDHYLDPRLDGWSQDQAAWRQARKLLAVEATAAVHPDRVSPRDLQAQRMAWRQLSEATRTVRVEQVTARVEPVDEQRFRATVSLELYNELNRPAEISLTVTSANQAWQTPPARTVTLAAGQRRTEKIELHTNVEQIRPGPKGFSPLTVRMEVAGKPTQEIAAGIPLLRADPPESPIRVDGVLTDWPLRAWNVAGDFRLVGKRGRTGDGLADPQTFAFVQADRENLYLAFRCEEPDLAAMTVRADNRLRYDQLLLGGEDLVEILLDPGADATGAQDLYHLVVKPGGVIVSERGISTEPPLGAWAPWAAGAKVAVARHGEAWFIECSVPRAAFGPAGRERLWAVNFARIRPAGGQASSWTGARRHFYDPDTLGTLLLPGGALQRPAPPSDNPTGKDRTP